MSAKKRRKRSSKVTRNAAQSKKITRPSPRKGLSSGPRKSEVKKLVAKLKVYRPSRIHKLRAGWFKARVSWPLRDRSAAYLHTQRRSSARRIAAAPVAANAVWQDAGPTNIGGRATAIVFDPANPDRILLGTGGGGVWKSLDAGQTWSPTMRTQEHNIGALALDPGDARIVYCGTGEAICQPTATPASDFTNQATLAVPGACWPQAPRPAYPRVSAQSRWIPSMHVT